jgi:hypothetical protein
VSFLKQVAYSLWKPASYAEFTRRGGRRALLYLLLIALPLAVTGAVRTGLTVRWACDSVARSLADGPSFEVRNGLLEFGAPQPYALVVDGTELGLVDTTGLTGEAYLDGRPGGLLFLRDRVIVQNGGRRQEMPYATLGANQPLTRETMAATLLRFTGLAWPLGLIWILFSLAAKFIAALVLSLLAWAVLAGRGRAGGFTEAWVIAAHALTLPLLLGFARVLSGADIAAFGLLYWGAAAVYCVAGTSSLPPARTDTTPGEAGAPPAPPPV